MTNGVDLIQLIRRQVSRTDLSTFAVHEWADDSNI